MFVYFTLFLSLAVITLASPLHGRAITELDKEAFAQAHSRDETATREFSSTPIKTSDGQCLFIDELSGDFRANLTPIQLAACDGSKGQLWDVITSGKHIDQPGKVLIVNTLTQACLDLNRGRAGREVTGFSCGGRADGDGQVSFDQLFAIANPDSFALTTERGEGQCLAVVGSALGIAPCAAGDAKQLFSIGASSAPESPATPSTAVVATTTAAVVDPVTTSAQATGVPTSACIITMVTVIATNAVYPAVATR